MRRALLVILSTFAVYSSIQAQSLTVFRSPWTISETVKRVEYNLQKKPVDAGDITKSVNLIGKETSRSDSVMVVSFTDEQINNDLLACEPTAVVDLPQKIVVWRENGDVYLGYMDPYFMKKRFLITGCDETIEEMTRRLLKIVKETIRVSE
ncbi:MAG: DUF302 domain-containing protein [Bacteroidota bacterium]